MTDRDITADGFTLPPKPPVQPCSPYERRLVSEKELLQKMMEMFPEAAKEIKKEFVKGYLEVKKRRGEA